jgi:stage II sporulation protein AA (anti-sigma F factor antagonist)
MRSHPRGGADPALDSDALPAEDGRGAVDAYLSSHNENHVEIAVRGEVDLASAETLFQRLVVLAHPATGQIALDLTHVTFMDCAGLHAVIAIAGHVHSRGGALRIAATSPEVARLFELSGLLLADSNVLDIHQRAPVTSSISARPLQNAQLPAPS